MIELASRCLRCPVCGAATEAQLAVTDVFASLRTLVSAQVVPVAAYDGRFDVWTIDAPLSEGCDGPELPEEVML
jgi:hypothetical protein